MEDAQSQTLDGILIQDEQGMNKVLDKLVGIAKTVKPRNIDTDPKYGDHMELYLFDTVRKSGERIRITYEVLRSAFPEKDGCETLCVSRSGKEVNLSISAKREGNSKFWKYMISPQSSSYS